MSTKRPAPKPVAKRAVKTSTTPISNITYRSYGFTVEELKLGKIYGAFEFDNKEKRKFFELNDLHTFLTLALEKVFCCETIYHAKEAKPHLDIDLFMQGVDPNDPEYRAVIQTALEELVGTLYSVIVEKVPTFTKEDILIYNSHRLKDDGKSKGTKWSFHIICQGVKLLGKHAHELLARLVYSRLSDTNPLKSAIDFSVYSASRHLRVLGSPKEDGEPPKAKGVFDNELKVITVDDFAKSLVQFYDDKTREDAHLIEFSADELATIAVEKTKEKRPKVEVKYIPQPDDKVTALPRIVVRELLILLPPRDKLEHFDKKLICWALMTICPTDWRELFSEYMSRATNKGVWKYTDEAVKQYKPGGAGLGWLKHLAKRQHPYVRGQYNLFNRWRSTFCPNEKEKRHFAGLSKEAIRAGLVIAIKSEFDSRGALALAVRNTFPTLKDTAKEMLTSAAFSNEKFESAWARDDEDSKAHTFGLVHYIIKQIERNKEWTSQYFYHEPDPFDRDDDFYYTDLQTMVNQRTYTPETIGEVYDGVRRTVALISKGRMIATKEKANKTMGIKLESAAAFYKELNNTYEFKYKSPNNEKVEVIKLGTFIKQMSAQIEWANLVFCPVAPGEDITISKEDVVAELIDPARNVMNQFIGFRAKKLDSFDLELTKPWFNLIEEGFPPEISQRVLNWFRAAVRYPRMRLPMMNIIGLPGCGKGSIAETFIKYIIGIDHGKIFDGPLDLFGQFNDPVVGLIFGCINEMKNLDQATRQSLKNILTAEFGQLKLKFKNQETMRQFIKLIATLNELPTWIEEAERRHWVIRMFDTWAFDKCKQEGRLAERKAHFEEVYNSFENGAADHIYTRLLTEGDISNWNPEDFPETLEHREAQALNRHPVDSYLDGWLWVTEYNLEIIRPITAAEMYKIYESKTKRNLASRNTFYERIRHHQDITVKVTSGKNPDKYYSKTIDYRRASIIAEHVVELTFIRDGEVIKGKSCCLSDLYESAKLLNLSRSITEDKFAEILLEGHDLIRDPMSGVFQKK
jgi:hypothetical protein